ncbi:MAG: hypothetical protein AB4060_03710 [Crocosphaera sp.]
MSRNFLSNLTTLITGTTAVLFLSQTNIAEAATIEFFNQSDFANATGDLTLIDFDSLTPGNGVITGNEFINEGLTIVHRDDQPIDVISLSNNNQISPNNINSPSNGISTSFFFGGGYNNSLSENYDFILTNPSSAAGLYIGEVGSGTNSPTQVQFLNSNGDVIAEEIFTINNPNLIGTGGNNRVFYGITSSEPIAIIRTIEPANDGDGIIYDDVQFVNNTQSVPESSNMLGIGFMGLLGIFWTFKTRK